MNSLVVAKSLQEKVDSKCDILGLKVYSVCGGFIRHEGVIRELSIYNHRLLGRLEQVWVEWFNHEGEDAYTAGHLTPYNAKEFKEWTGTTGKIGVYYTDEYYNEQP